MIIPNIWKNKKCSKPPTSDLNVDWTLHSIDEEVSYLMSSNVNTSATDQK
jgi:hypothetical protein